MAEPQGLLAKTQMPNFSILGMIMGGRGYASDWFSTRDKLNLVQAQAETEAANRASSVNRLTAGPEWGAMIKDPYNREGLGNLWRRANQPDIDPTTGKTATGLVESGFANIYGREGQDYGAAIQKASQLFGQKIAQENVDYGAKVDLQLSRQKQIDEASALTQQWKAAFGDNPAMMQSLMQGHVLKSAGVNLPSETLPTMMNGQLVGVPIPGGKLYNETIEPILAQSSLNQMIDGVVSTLDKGAVIDSGTVERLRGEITVQYMKARGLGSLDAGTQKLLDDLFPPSMMAGGSWSPVERSQYSEKWRAAKMVNDGRLASMKKYAVLPFDVNAAQLGGTRTRADAEAAAADAKRQKGAQQQQIDGPQSNPRFGQPRVTGGQTGRGGGSIWNPAAKTRTGGGY